MHEFLAFVILGIATGCVYALPAQGLVLIYRGSGVLNFAQGAFGLVGGYAFYKLGMEHGWPVVLSLVVALLFSAAMGVTTHFGLMVPLRRASPLVRVVATLGLMYLVLAIANYLFGFTGEQVKTPLPHGHVTILGARLTQDRLWLILIAVVITIALDLGMRTTTFGRATQAVAENSTAVASMGYSPNLIAACNWGLGGGLAGAGAILIAPILNLQPDALILVSLRALAAALVGRFLSFRLTMAAAIGIGISESLLARYVEHGGAFKPLTSSDGYLASVFSGQALSESVAFFVIIVVMTIGGRSLPLRGTLFDRLPALGDGIIRWPSTLVGVAIVGVLIGISPPDWTLALTTSLATSVILTSVVLVVGYTGQISLAQAAFAGIGMWAAGRLVSAHGWPFLAALSIAVVITAAVGYVFGFPALRTRGVLLAVITFGLAVCVANLILENPKLTGAFEGTPINKLNIFGFSLDPFVHPVRYELLVVIYLVLSMFVLLNVRRSSTGRQLIAIRGNERAAASLGIDVARTKLFAFSVGAALAAVGGIALAFRQPQLNFNGFTGLAGVNLIIWTVLGGVGYLVGPLVGGLMAAGGVGTQLFDSFGLSGDAFNVVAGALLLFNIVANPDGVAHNFAEVKRKVTKKRLRRPIAVPEDVTAERVVPKVLRLKDVSVRFGGVTAVDSVSLELRPGEVVGIIGPNGAGKTTLLDAITGYATVAQGSVELDDVALTRLPAYRRARLGVARSWQSLELFEDLSVGENVLVACHAHESWRRVRDLVRPGVSALTPSAVIALREVGLLSSIDESPQELSQGKRRVVGVARAAASWPSVLLLDEPAAGLSGAESEELGILVRRLAHEYGMAVGLIEHDMDLVMSVCDRVIVLESGGKIADGTPAAVRKDEGVVAAYLGVAQPTVVTSA